MRTHPKNLAWNALVATTLLLAGRSHAAEVSRYQALADCAAGVKSVNGKELGREGFFRLDAPEGETTVPVLVYPRYDAKGAVTSAIVSTGSSIKEVTATRSESAHGTRYGFRVTTGDPVSRDAGRGISKNFYIALHEDGENKGKLYLHPGGVAGGTPTTALDDSSEKEKAQAGSSRWAKGAVPVHDGRDEPHP